MKFLQRPRDWFATALLVSIFANAGLKIFGGVDSSVGLLVSIGLVAALVGLVIFWGYDALKTVYRLEADGSILLEAKGKEFHYDGSQELLLIVKRSVKQKDATAGETYSYQLHVASNGVWEDFRLSATPEELEALLDAFIALGAQWFDYGPGDDLLKLIGTDKEFLPFRLREPVATMGLILGAIMLVLFAGVVVQGLLMKL